MPRIPIDRIDDPLVEIYRDLPGATANRWSGLFIAESEQVVLRLLETDYEVVSVLANTRVADRITGKVPPSVPLYVAPDALVRDIVGFNFHRGAVACGRRRSPPPLKDFMPARDQPFTAVICPHLVDPENLGGILRTCAAFGVDAVWVGACSTDPFSRRVIRVSMGAALQVPVLHSEDLETDLERLRGEFGIEFLAAVADPDAEPLPATRRPSRVGLLLGHEGHGLDDRWLSFCSRRVTVPMEAGIDSLNVAVTAGILLYHFTKAQPATGRPGSPTGRDLTR